MEEDYDDWGGRRRMLVLIIVRLRVKLIMPMMFVIQWTGLMVALHLMIRVKWAKKILVSVEMKRKRVKLG
ncbi:hypothetical protein L1987_74018 [Smallanthus sonchifolius]|uniref:Uncharacterized protein n=1 Tax=Smallanthus sonchifolius TaxID=185202 RepID=A0ACB9A1X2_9ASTR|nr:hypothetical protein L1987_74018 [Smallanthus sonchifolius]